MTNDSTFFIGLDLGDMHSFIAILGPDGVLTEENRLTTLEVLSHQ